MGEEQPPADEPAAETPPPPGVHPTPVAILMVLAGLAFVATAYLAVRYEYSAVLGPIRFVILASTGILTAALVAGRWVANRAVSAACAVLVMLACVGSIYAGVASSRLHDDLRERYRAGRQGPRVIQIHTDQGREIAVTMLVSIAASIATITALPLSAYFVVRVMRRPKPSVRTS